MTLDRGEITRVTMEHCIIAQTGYNPKFSLPGDSGALIFDRFGTVVGLLFGSSEAKNTSYFMYIHDVFDQIKAATGALDVRFME